MPNKTTKEILDVTYKQLIASLQNEQTRLHDNWQRIKTRDTDLAEVIESQEDSIAHV